VKTPSKPAGAYRPPGARGTVTPLHFKREDEGGAAHINNGSSSSSAINGFGKARRREVPGAELATERLPPGAAPGGGVSLTSVGEGDEGLSKAALKNKKKREAKKIKEASEKASGESPTGDVFSGGDGNPNMERSNVNRSPERWDRSNGRIRSRSNLGQRNSSQRRDNRGREPSKHRRNQSSQGRGMGSHMNSAMNSATASMTNLVIAPNPIAPQAVEQSSSATPELSVTSPGGGSPQDKKLRGLLKKVRAIEDLKMRLAGGEKLEDTQMKKIATEDGVRKELEALGWNG
jgi:translation initiation factor 2A